MVFMLSLYYTFYRKSACTGTKIYGEEQHSDLTTFVSSHYYETFTQ